MFAACRGVRYLIEQPNGSALDVHPAFRRFCDWSEAGLVIVIFFLHFLVVIFCLLQVWSISLWHGLYYFFKETPKRQRLWSNDEELLKRIVAVSGKLPLGSSMRSFQGEPLTKRRKLPDGTVQWSGKQGVLKASQNLTCTSCECVCQDLKQYFLP